MTLIESVTPTDVLLVHKFILSGIPLPATTKTAG
jgi:hypothetical protein